MGILVFRFYFTPHPPPCPGCSVGWYPKQKGVLFARIAVTKYHKLGGFPEEVYCLRGQKSKIKVLSGLVPSEGCEGESVPCLLPNLQQFAGNLWYSLVCRSIALISGFTFTWHSPYVHVSVFKWSHFIKTSVILDQEPHLVKDPISKSQHILRYQGLRLQRKFKGEHN